MRKCQRCGAIETPAAQFVDGICTNCHRSPVRVVAPPRAASNAAVIPRVLVWLPLLLWIAGCVFNHLATRPDNVMQQCALAANTLVALAAGYFVSRAFDRMLVH